MPDTRQAASVLDTALDYRRSGLCVVVKHAPLSNRKCTCGDAQCGTMERPQRACLWLRVRTDTKGHDPELQLTDFKQVCEQRGWQIVHTYQVEESAFGKKPRERFASMVEEARKGKFDVLVVWSMDRFSREGGWSVSRIMVALQDWNLRFYSYNEPFLDTTGPLAGFLIPLFAWLARQESIRKGKAVKLGMDKARAKGKHVGRPVVVDKVDAEFILRLRSQGNSWRQIA